MLLLALTISFAGSYPPPYELGADGLPVVNPDLNAEFPVDPEVYIGHLPNGLTYFIETNGRPDNRAELRMVVKAGSILEEDNQRGIAHYLEHMAFNGSKHFPEDSAITAIEAFGARFGAHVNASTGFDETVFKLQVPTDDPKAIDTALRIFADQAGALTFDPLECAREVGVVTEEWRLDQGLPQRMQDAIFPLLFHGSKYVDRLPIGTTDGRPRFDCAEARRYWETWYRPDQIAVMAVGDFDTQAVEKLIRKRFSKLRAPADPAPRTYERIPDHEEILTSVFADPEVTECNVVVFDKYDDIEDSHQRSYRELFVEQMAFIAVNERLAEHMQTPASPFTLAYVETSGLGHERGAQTLNISAKEGREVEALRVAYTEVERARRHGFQPGEIARAKRALALGLHDYYSERETTDSETHIEELIRVFTTDEPMPGIPYEYAMSRYYLPDIKPEEVNDWSKEHFFLGRSRAVSLMMPLKAGLAIPAEADLSRTLVEVHQGEVAAPAAEIAEKPLMAALPEPGRVQPAGEDSLLGTVTWKLSNGATVIVKPTSYQADEVLLEAFSPGGTSAVTDADYIPAITATALQRRSGLGDLTAMDLGRMLSGRRADADPYVGGLYEGISGASTVADLELMLQRVHMVFTAPRFDPDAFALEKARREEDLRNRGSSPDSWLWDTWQEKLWQGNPRYTNWKFDDLEEMDLARSEAVFRDRFSNLSDWTFVFVGSVDPAALEPLVARYVASLPAGGRAEVPMDDGARRVSGVIKEQVEAGDTPRAHVLLTFHGPFDANWQSRSEITAVGEVLQSALRGELREDRGGTYGVSVDAEANDGPVETYTVTIDFQCDPQRVDELVDATWEIIDLVRENTVREQGMVIMRSQRTRDHETDVGSNGWWISEIAGALQRSEDPDEILAFDQRNAALSGERIRAMAQKVLDRDQYLLVVQRP